MKAESSVKWTPEYANICVATGTQLRNIGEKFTDSHPDRDVAAPGDYERRTSNVRFHNLVAVCGVSDSLFRRSIHSISKCNRLQTPTGEAMKNLIGP